MRGGGERVMKRLLFVILVFCIVSVFFVNANVIEVKFDFDDFPVDEYVNRIDEFMNEWEIFTASAETNYVQVSEEDGNKYITLNGLADVRTWDMLEPPYTLSFDAKTSATKYVGFFVRGVYPVIKHNPANAGGIKQVLHYLEIDWYEQNGGQNGTTGLGGSGISIMPGEGCLRLNIKTYEEDGLKIGNAYYDFDYPEEFDPSEFFNVMFKDDGEKVEIYINQELLATVEMSNPGKYDDDEEDDNEYFNTAVVTDASGEEVLRIDNARISAYGSQLAITTRAQTAHIDNLILTYEGSTPSPEPEVTETPTSTKNSSATPSPTENIEKTNDDSSGMQLAEKIIVVGVAVIIVVGIILVVLKRRKK